MRKLICIIINYLANFFKIQDNKILFQSGRNKVDGNPYAIYKYIKEKCPNDFRCVWLVEKEADISMLEKGDYYYYHTLTGILNQITSKYWIRSQSLGGIIEKRKEQIYIQTWHGAGNLKKCENDCLPNDRRTDETVYCAKDWDYLIATDEPNKIAMISGFGFKKKIFLLGNLETDLLIKNNNEKYKKQVRDKINLKDNKKKIIMYAPTFRDTDLNKNGNDLKIPIMELSKLNNCLVLLRLHPLISKKIENIKLPNNFINVGWYPNILDLYLITDILITDYSSVIFPYMLLEKSLIMYPYDYDDYIKLRGGFYLDYHKDLPGPIVYNEKDLINEINNILNNKNDYKAKIDEFNKKYNSLNDGNVCKKFIKLLKNKEFK